jgi:ABC-2 type transport system ATP-binding protein
VGYLVEAATAYPNLTVRENLEIQRRLTGAPREATGRAISLLGLEEYAERRAAHLSLGNKQRLSLARALVHRPEVVILDEPANGLDPAGIREIRELLRRLADEDGVSVFMSSHILAEVGQLADRIAIIHDGRLVEELDRDAISLRKRLHVELETNDPARAQAILGGLGLREFSQGGEGVLRVADPDADTSAIARSVVGAGLDLRRLVAVEEDLETRFMRLTGGAS